MSRLTATMPIALVGSMAMALNVTGQIQSAEATPIDHAKPIANLAAGKGASFIAATVKTTVATPATYRVVRGDSVSRIAARFGLKTATVLALNGLNSRSLIFPGQILTLSAGPVLVSSVKPIVALPTGGARYTIVSGDTISAIAGRYGVSTQLVLAANGLVASSIIHPGQSILIPGIAQTPKPTVTKPTVTTPTTPPVAPPVTPLVNPPVTAPTDDSTQPTSLIPDPPAQSVASTTTYVIESGDNVTKIAARFGVTIQSILDANGLTRSSIIYTGHALTIPGAHLVPASSSSIPAGATNISVEAQGNARSIIAVGRLLGVSDYGIVIALSAALQESTLRNLGYGDQDSVGLFQQRPSAGWGTVAQLTDPTYAARLFFGGPTNPNKGRTRGLLDIAGWQNLTVTQAAQRVQVSAYPNAYAKWETTARYWLAKLG